MEKVITKKKQSSSIYNFEYGLPGFEHLSKFEFKNLEDFPPFKLFQSVDIPDISMIVIDGRLLKIYENVAFPNQELSNLNISDKKYMRIFVILRIDEENKHFIANTKAPILLNTYSGLGKQVILDSTELSEEYKLDKF